MLIEILLILVRLGHPVFGASFLTGHTTFSENLVKHW